MNRNLDEGILVMLNDDGVAEEYDDTWDVTIHCESEEQQQDVMDKLTKGWILCSDRMPEERESIFAKLKGTNKWNPSMFETISDNVIVTVRFAKTQEKKSEICHTCNGEWKKPLNWLDGEIIAWMPLPEPYK